MENKSKLIKVCETCGINSTCLCFICNEYFCDSCFKMNHDKQMKINHKKEKIDLYVPIDLKCQAHPNIPLNLFCVDEKGKSNNIIDIYFKK